MRTDIEEAIYRIKIEAEIKTGRLDLSCLSILYIPESVTELVHLRVLYCNDTHITDLAPLENLKELRHLFCSNTRVSNTTAISKLSSLMVLNISNTHISDLHRLTSLTQLIRLDANGLHLSEISLDMLSCWKLSILCLHKTVVNGIPAEIFSKTPDDNCLSRLMAHLADVADGAEVFNPMKLIVLGNGKVGKTQICNYLKNKPFVPDWDSTHGIEISECKIGSQVLKLWDFGGQDIYHGTHALFMRTRAIFVIAWDPEIEARGSGESSEDFSRNYPLEYWIEYVRILSGAQSPVIVVQTKCVDIPSKVSLSIGLRNKLREFDHFQEIAICTRTRFGLIEFDQYLHAAVGVYKYHRPTGKVGKGRMQVIRHLERITANDTSLALNRTLTQSTFRDLCERTGGVSSVDEFLLFLHDAGIILYNKDLFKDEIILDQKWALNAIYSVFERTKVLPYLRDICFGRFDRHLLEMLAWKGYPSQQQETFVNLMLSCGICFTLSNSVALGSNYIAPDLLPIREVIAHRLPEKWNDSSRFEEVILRFPLLHEGLIRGVLSSIGEDARLTGIYWKGGVCVYEINTKSRALIEQTKKDNGWGGTITIRTQNGDAKALLTYLHKKVLDQCHIVGLSPEQSGLQGRSQELVPRYGNEHQYELHYLSYAWADKEENIISDEQRTRSQEREEAANKICSEALLKGIRIIRDIDVVKNYGDSILEFMNRLSHGERVYVVLSDKYLTQENCVYELCCIWENIITSKQNFAQHVFVYVADKTNLYTSTVRQKYATFWSNRHAEIVGPRQFSNEDLLYNPALIDVRISHKVLHYLPQVLHHIGTTMQLGTFEEFISHAFGRGEAKV